MTQRTNLNGSIIKDIGARKEKGKGMKIHKSAIVHPDAILEEGVEIGPFSIIGANVTIGEGTTIKNHVTITGNTSLGANNIIHPYAVLGAEAQDLKYRGECTLLDMGENNVVREGVTIKAGTAGGGGKTVIGDNNFFMACAHVSPDCIIKNNILFSNYVFFVIVKIRGIVLLSNFLCLFTLYINHSI